MLPAAKAIPIQFHKAVVSGFQRIIRDYELHRIECNVLSTFQPGIRWATSLGFHQEGLRRKAGPNKEDMVMMAMFP